MSPQLQSVEEQALLLSLKEREILVERLLTSLQEALPEIDPAWITEADRRYLEYKEGRVPGIPSNRVFDEIRQELGWLD